MNDSVKISTQRDPLAGQQKPNAPSREELARIHLLDSVKEETYWPLLRDCPVRQLVPGAQLLQTGESNNELYMLLSGRLRVHLKGERENPIAILEAGETVGEVSVIDRQPSTADVVADQNSRLLVVSTQLHWTLVERSPEWARNIILAMAHRMRRGNDMLHQSKERLEQIAQEANIDPLTGLYNRRWLDDALGSKFNRRSNDQRPFVVLMIDIDHFKRFNDTYGHPAGDQALATVAKCLQEHLRPDDLVARYGGEEMIAILPGINCAGGMIVAERICAAVRRTPIKADDGRQLPPVTLSIGLAQMNPENKPNDVIVAADMALYDAKMPGAIA